MVRKAAAITTPITIPNTPCSISPLVLQHTFFFVHLLTLVGPFCNIWHLTLLRCIALLYFAIRLESHKSANKRIYLSIYRLERQMDGRTDGHLTATCHSVYNFELTYIWLYICLITTEYGKPTFDLDFDVERLEEIVERVKNVETHTSDGRLRNIIFTPTCPLQRQQQKQHPARDVVTRYKVDNVGKKSSATAGVADRGGANWKKF